MFRIIEVDKGVIPNGIVKLFGSRTFKDYYMEALPTPKSYSDCKSVYERDMYYDWITKLITQTKNLKKKDDFLPGK